MKLAILNVAMPNNCTSPASEIPEDSYKYIYITKSSKLPALAKRGPADTKC